MIAIDALGRSQQSSAKNVDTLSTIALALAVLAFAAQLIVSLAQGMAGAQQVAQTERINADTAVSPCCASGQQRCITNHSARTLSKVLSAMLERAAPEAVDATLAENAQEDEGPGETSVEQLEQLRGVGAWSASPAGDQRRIAGQLARAGRTVAADDLGARHYLCPPGHPWCA
ncbi:hypothetical protein AB0880_27240 [Micromonospora chersina]|uniref:hypothetical protein n=1 Tax=Micromonospora chersina TaxID=47854 RepID=UPI003451C4BF